MRVEFVGFGEITINGMQHTHDVVIAAGQISERDKQPSRQYKQQFGHTPLSIGETIPWDCQRLIIGTGVYGKLPVMLEVHQYADEHGIEVVAVPTPQACELVSAADLNTTNAILHLTC